MDQWFECWRGADQVNPAGAAVRRPRRAAGRPDLLTRRRSAPVHAPPTQCLGKAKSTAYVSCDVFERYFLNKHIRELPDERDATTGGCGLEGNEQAATA